MNCLSCGRAIPANIFDLVGIEGHISGLCEHCTRLVWAGSMDAQTVVNSLIALLIHAEQYGEFAANELLALAHREPDETPLF